MAKKESAGFNTPFEGLKRLRSKPPEPAKLREPAKQQPQAAPAKPQPVPAPAKPANHVDVAPKHIEKDRRYFQGRIWVDDHDFQIVKTHGKNVPDLGTGKKGGQENLFPAFTTWREQIDGKYWFPTYTLVNDDLHFRTGDVHVKQVVKYTNYKRFGANVKITYEGQDIKPGEQPQGQPTQQTQTAPPPKNPK